jgi:hypothetical protein
MKKDPLRCPARTAQPFSWLLDEVSVKPVISTRRERPRLT